MSSLLDLLMSMPSPQDRLNQIQQLQAMTPNQVSAPSGPAHIDTSGGDWQDIAHQLAQKRYGYDAKDINELDYIVGHESSWNPNAVNPNGGAYGIPQILPSAHPGLNLQDDPMGQIRWMLHYIQQRYGGIDQAYQHKTSTGWY